MLSRILVLYLTVNNHIFIFTLQVTAKVGVQPQKASSCSSFGFSVVETSLRQVGSNYHGLLAAIPYKPSSEHLAFYHCCRFIQS